jgi:hypothetical protein
LLAEIEAYRNGAKRQLSVRRVECPAQLNYPHSLQDAFQATLIG